MKRKYIEFSKNKGRTQSGKSARPRPGRKRSRAFDDDTISTSIDRRSLPSDTLCADCRRLEFDNISFNIERYLALEKPTWPRQKVFVPNCALCDMARSLLKVDLGDGCGWLFRAFLSIKAGEYLRDSENVTNTGRTVFLAVERANLHRCWQSGQVAIETLEDGKFDKSSLRGLICVQDSGTPGNGKRTVPVTGSNEINQHEADFGLMRQWLEQKCRSHVPITSKFRCRVIDCEDQVVVQHAPSMKYVALSYVWGESELANGSETVINPPQTVKDAMYATKRLGQRYLWVDRYCIPEEGNERHVHIANMHLIYEAAYVTIVAANPGPKDSAHSGLYGVSKPRNLQNKFNHDGKSFVSTHVHPAYQLSQSVWATRGWTYQEATLSSRCLLFTSDQVYYADSSGYQVESLRHSLSTRPEGAYRTLEVFYQAYGPALVGYDPQLNPFGHGANEADSYEKHLMEYTKRRLTFPSDALNAFRGILAKVAGPSVWGIPFMPSQSGSVNISIASDLCFAKYLCWTGESSWEERQKKLIHFPSWSWASTSNIRAPSPRFQEGVPEAHLPARFGVERADGSVVALRDLISERSKSHQSIPEETFFLHVTSWVFEATTKLDEQKQTWHVTGLRNSPDQNINGLLALGDNWNTHFDVQGSSLAIFEVKPHVVVTAVLLSMVCRTDTARFLLFEPGADFYRRVGLLEVTHSDQLTAYLLEKAMKYQPVTIRLG
ncbi:hypothetical protein LTR47_000402 [Exophiala xenobiotica]|nr:hypothetical protein LTR47_000402 [Exophiala xenobiotica]